MGMKEDMAHARDRLIAHDNPGPYKLYANGAKMAEDWRKMFPGVEVVEVGAIPISP